MRHPFLRLSRDQLPKFFWPMFLSTIILLFIMNMLSQPLVTSQAPGGIISFELAKTPAKSTAIMNSWDSTQKLIAAFSLGLDYLVHSFLFNNFESGLCLDFDCFESTKTSDRFDWCDHRLAAVGCGNSGRSRKLFFVSYIVGRNQFSIFSTGILVCGSKIWHNFCRNNLVRICIGHQHSKPKKDIE